MRYNKLDLNLLIALRALLAEKSVTRAGDLINLTQPAMSGVLARLREYFDDPLIVQIGRRAELTELAKGLVEPVNDVLQRIDATIATRPAFDPSRSHRHFTLVASEYVSRVLLIDVLHRLRQQAPGVTITLRQPDGNAAAELETDADLVITPEAFASSAHAARVLFEDFDIVLVDAANTDVGESIALEKFLELEHVAFRSAKHGRTMFDSWYEARHQRERRVQVFVDSFAIVPQLLLGTRRITTLPSRIARQVAADLPLRVVEPLFEIPRMVEVLQWPKHRDYDSGSEWLRARIIEGAQALPAVQPQPRKPDAMTQWPASLVQIDANRTRRR